MLAKGEGGKTVSGKMTEKTPATPGCVPDRRANQAILHIASGDAASTAESFAGRAFSYKAPRGSTVLAGAKRRITITAASGIKVYDGAPLENDGYTAGRLAPGHVLHQVTVTGSQTKVGIGINVPSGARIYADGIDVTESYDIAYECGRLTVLRGK